MKNLTSLLRTVPLQFQNTRIATRHSFERKLADAKQRNLLENAKFKPIYQLTPEAKDKVIMSVYKKLALGLAPSIAYLAYFITHLPFNLFYLSGFIITESMGSLLSNKICDDHKRTVESIEICEEYNAIRFKMLDLNRLSSIVHTENSLFNNGNRHTFTFDMSSVRAYNKLFLENFSLPSGNRQASNIVTFIGNDLNEVTDMIADLNCNALEQYNAYIKKLEKDNDAKGEACERTNHMIDIIKKTAEKRNKVEKEAQ